MAVKSAALHSSAQNKYKLVGWKRSAFVVLPLVNRFSCVTIM